MRPRAQPSVQTLIRLKPSTAEGIRRAADKKSMSMNAWLTAVIEQALSVEKP